MFGDGRQGNRIVQIPVTGIDQATVSLPCSGIEGVGLGLCGALSDAGRAKETGAVVQDNVVALNMNHGVPVALWAVGFIQQRRPDEPVPRVLSRKWHLGLPTICGSLGSGNELANLRVVGDLNFMQEGKTRLCECSFLGDKPGFFEKSPVARPLGLERPALAPLLRMGHLCEIAAVLLVRG